MLSKTVDAICPNDLARLVLIKFFVPEVSFSIVNLHTGYGESVRQLQSETRDLQFNDRHRRKEEGEREKVKREGKTD
jgi:hypothetical protein